MLHKRTHVLTPVAVSDGAAMVPLAMFVARQPRTAVLFRCEDPRHPDCYAVRMYEGTWKLSDFDGLRSDWPAEITRDDLPPVTQTGAQVVVLTHEHEVGVSTDEQPGGDGSGDPAAD